MDTHTPRPDDDLNNLERRLSDWRPSAAGLDPEGMLFAAGRASARATKARLLWPAASACLALLTMVLGFQMTAERAERLALAEQIRQQPPAPAPAPSAVPLPDSQAAETPGPDSYLAARRALERDPDAWAAQAVAKGGPLPGPPPPGHHILQAWRPGGTLEP